MLYPRTGTTKGEVLNYYAQVAPVLLPLLARPPGDPGPLAARREGTSFFEKNAPAGTPSWVRTADVPTTGSRGRSRRTADTLVFPIIDDLATLTWLANLAALELHVHQWTVGRNGQPAHADRLVIDLDPGEPAGLHECCQVALLVRDKLAERELDARPVTSGSKGLHLYADLAGAAATPTETTATGEGGRRGAAGRAPEAGHGHDDQGRALGKVFLDWSQNAGSKTTISPYSLRGRELPDGRDARSPGTRSRRAPRTRSGSSSSASSEVLERVAEHGDLFAD